MAKAAAALGRTQPAVSQEIRTLEAHLGVRLLDRTAHGVVLTAYGTIAYERYRSVLRTCGEVHDEIARRRSQGRTVLRIGASAYPGGYLVPYAMGAFRAEHPDVGLDLLVRSIPDLLSLLGAHDLDIAVLDGRLAAPGVTLDVLGTDRLEVVGAAAAFPEPAELSLDEWLSLPHVLCDERCTATSLFAQLAAQRLDTGRLRVAASVESLEAAKALVQAGVGVGAFPTRAVRGEVQADTLRILTVRGLALRSVVTVAHAGSGTLAPMAQAFADRLRDDLSGRAHGRLRRI
jgi:DNA-binding transcriptional LysR family regulator